MEVLSKIILEIKKIIPYLAIIIIYFIIINLESIRDRSIHRRNHHIENDFDTSMPKKAKVSETTSINSKRVPIPVFPYNED